MKRKKFRKKKGKRESGTPQHANYHMFTNDPTSSEFLYMIFVKIASQKASGRYKLIEPNTFTQNYSNLGSTLEYIQCD